MIFTLQYIGSWCACHYMLFPDLKLVYDSYCPTNALVTIIVKSVLKKYPPNFTWIIDLIGTTKLHNNYHHCCVACWMIQVMYSWLGLVV